MAYKEMYLAVTNMDGEEILVNLSTLSAARASPTVGRSLICIPGIELENPASRNSGWIEITYPWTDLRLLLVEMIR